MFAPAESMLHDSHGVCAIYLKHDDKLVEMIEEPYEAEEILQKLLADYPNLLGGDRDSRVGKRWLLVQREIGVPAVEGAGGRWSVDHLFLDNDGVPTLVEVKRSTDTRIRREVVGQMLDYAANASSYWALEGIRTAFESRHDDVDQAEHVMLEFLGGDTDAADGFWERVGVNLQARKLRLVFVADEIPSELRRVIEFLNEQMSTTEVLGLEVRQFVERGGTRQTLVPRLIGQTEAARGGKTKGAPSEKWRAAGLKAAATRRHNAVVATIRDAQPPDLADRVICLYEFMRDAGAEASWEGGEHPSVTMWLGKSSDPDQNNPVSVSFYAAGVSINFTSVREHRSATEMTRLVELARQIPGYAQYLVGIEGNNYGMHAGMRPDEVLSSDEALETFERVVREASKPA